MPGGSISLVLADVDAPIVNELFNTHVVNADGIACNRSYTTLAPGNGGVSGWQWWPEPVPPVGGTPVQSAVPTEQLALTHDQTEFMYYAATLPASTPAAASKAHGANSVNLTIGTREASAFALFVGGEFVGSTDDHTKGPNPVTLTLAVPASAKTRYVHVTPRLDLLPTALRNGGACLLDTINRWYGHVELAGTWFSSRHRSASRTSTAPTPSTSQRGLSAA